MLSRVEDTFNEEGEPFHQNPGRAPKFRKKSTQMGVASSQKLQEHRITAILTPPPPTAQAVSGGHGGGGVE